jgi:hypothetical protein
LSALTLNDCAKKGKNGDLALRLEKQARVSQLVAAEKSVAFLGRAQIAQRVAITAQERKTREPGSLTSLAASLSASIEGVKPASRAIIKEAFMTVDSQV